MPIGRRHRDVDETDGIACGIADPPTVHLSLQQIQALPSEPDGFGGISSAGLRPVAQVKHYVSEFFFGRRRRLRRWQENGSFIRQLMERERVDPMPAPEPKTPAAPPHYPEITDEECPF